MATNGPRAITFLAAGQDVTGDRSATSRSPAALPLALSRGEVKQSVVIGAQRGGGTEVRISAVPGEDVVVLQVANGPSLVLHPENVRDLLCSQVLPPTARGAIDETESPTELRIPARLQWKGLDGGAAASRGVSRGSLGGVLLSGIQVITGLFKDTAADLAATEVVKRVDGQVDPGVYQLNPQSLSVLKGTPKAHVPIEPAHGGKPILVLVHGTFSSTSGTFSKLWTQHPERVAALFKHYEGRVYGLEHPTLGASPIENAQLLAEALPPGARIHLVTHSRGGLVAEVLARLCSGDPPTDKDLTGFFKGKDYAEQRRRLESLAGLLRKQDIKVERVVRVACPARGTLLASKRLDAYLSVFKWTLELAGIPVAPAVVDFLAEVARRRADPTRLPGLAAQIPDSPLIQWLHSVEQPIAGELRVVAGDIDGDSVISWLKTLLADAFYLTDNDLVVQTRSMYSGAPRAGGATFLFDQGGKVSHFAYFTNDRTAEAIVGALVEDDPPAAFRTIGPLSWAGKSSTGFRARPQSADIRAPGDRPAVFILPGILGSNLKADGKRIWLGWRILNGLGRLEYGVDARIEPDGALDRMYDDLSDFLAETHEPVEFAFDWRLPIEKEADRLADAVAAALDARARSGQPVRLLAHSMGGLVARVMQLERPEVWDRMMSVPGARVLMLGTPNAGSWAPMQVLSGDDTFGNALAMCGAPFHEQDARGIMAGFPGFLQLQAGLLDPALQLGSSATWKRLAEEDLARSRQASPWHYIRQDSGWDGSAALRWGVPPDDVLKQAVALRERLDRQREHELAPYANRMALVVGKARSTPDGYKLVDDGLVYLDALDHGDGRVTLSSALLPGVRTWELDVDHGSLPKKKEAFPAYLDLLERGATERLALPAGVSRGGEAAPPVHVMSRPSRGRVGGPPPADPGDLFAAAGPEEPIGPAAEGPALSVIVHNGNLAFVREPFVLGHYRSLRLTGSELVMDRLIGGGLSAALKVGLYPDAVGSTQVFANARTSPDGPSVMPRPEAVIVVGLGPEGALKPSQLRLAVRQGVIAWAQRLAERPAGPPAAFELAAALVGSGGAGITTGQAAQMIAQGVRDANQRLDQTWPHVDQLHLVELYLDRAAEAWRSLQVLARAEPASYRVIGPVSIGLGALNRPVDSDYRGTAYDFLSAVARDAADGDAIIEFRLDTRRARSEVRAQHTQGRLVKQLIKSASGSSEDGQIGNTLFRLLVPIELESYFAGTTEMQIEVDAGTAGIPWELLDPGPTSGGNEIPWAIRSKLVRKLRTDVFRESVTDASPEAYALIIGEPACDDPYPRLPAAREEAIAVGDLLKRQNALGAERVEVLVSTEPATKGPNAKQVINTLLDRNRPWRIVHIAGHGEPPLKIGPKPATCEDPPQKDGDPRGVVLSDCNFLGPREINCLRIVPELVFINCCHLAARSEGELLKPRPEYDRARFAAGVAEALIGLGVRCVVAAGWAVNDVAARKFATAFYRALLGGSPFIDAVAAARTEARAEGGNTWAAYQCYGDPDWTLRRTAADPQSPPAPIAQEFVGIASSTGLALALDNIAVESTYRKKPEEQERQQAKIRHLEVTYGGTMGTIGRVAEAFGHAWSESGNRAKAIEWYRRALAANDGSASLRASEQLGNALARHAWEAVGQAVDRRDAAGAKGEDPAVMAAARGAAGPLREAIDLLQRVLSIQATMEREGLLAAAYKRQAMVAAATGDKALERESLERMLIHYRASFAKGQEQQLPDLYYAGLNLIAAELVTAARFGRELSFDQDPDLRELVRAVQQSLDAKARADQDFPSAASTIELQVYLAIARGMLDQQLPFLRAQFTDLHLRVSAPRWWGSVRDQARFVFSYVMSRLSRPDRAAAGSLLNLLIGFAPFAPGETGRAATAVRGGPAPRRKPTGRRKRK